MKNSAFKTFIIIVSLIVGLIIIGKLVNSIFGSPGISENNNYNPKYAYWMSKQFVENNLKSPSTADFPSYNDPKVSVAILGDKEYRVNAYVDAQNAFGAMIRTTYHCVVKYKYGDTWELISLTFDD